MGWRVFAVAAFVVLSSPGIAWAQGAAVPAVGGAAGIGTLELGGGNPGNPGESGRALDSLEPNSLLSLEDRLSQTIDALPRESLAGLEVMEQSLLLLGAPSLETAGPGSMPSPSAALDRPVGSASLIERSAEGDDPLGRGKFCPSRSGVCVDEHRTPQRRMAIFFDATGARMRPESYLMLDRVVALLKRQPNTVVEVSGHSDGLGSEDFNRRLSRQRARVVFDYLVNQGIEPERLYARALGSQWPVSPELVEGRDFADRRAANRRVELRVFEETGTASLQSD